MSVTLLLGSRLGDLFGRRRVLLVSLGGFITASVLCAAAPDPDTLIAARALQGAVAALMVPQGFGLIREPFGDEGQQRAFAVFGPVMDMGAVAGPLVGGGLIDLNVLGSGWRAIFLVNVPLGLAAIAPGRRYLPRVAPSAAGKRLDVPSVVLAMAGGVALIYPFIQGREHGWPLWCFALIGAGLVTLAVFGRLQTRRAGQERTPLVEPSILRRRPCVAELAVVIGFIGAMGGMVIALNVMYQTGLGFSPLECGVATASIPLAAIGGSITSSMLLARLGRTTMHIGIAERVIAFPQAAGAAAHGHGGGRSLLDHLTRTYEIAGRWEQPSWLQHAALIHSVYGTEAYRQQLIAVTRRHEVSALVGERAERLAHRFATAPRRLLFAGTQRRAPDASPGSWLAGLRDRAEALFDSGAVTLPLFVATLAGFTADDESACRGAYRDGVASSDPAVRAERLAMAAACPVVGEPCVWLADEAQRRGELTAAREWARAAEQRLLGLGTSWDKRLRFDEWLTLARLLGAQTGERGSVAARDPPRSPRRRGQRVRRPGRGAPRIPLPRATGARRCHSALPALHGHARRREEAHRPAARPGSRQPPVV